MTTQTTKTVTVVRYSDGQSLGEITMDAAEWATYEDCTHPDYQWPEGIAQAGQVLSDDQMDALGIDPATVIGLD